MNEKQTSTGCKLKRKIASMSHVYFKERVKQRSILAKSAVRDERLKRDTLAAAHKSLREAESPSEVISAKQRVKEAEKGLDKATAEALGRIADLEYAQALLRINRELSKNPDAKIPDCICRPEGRPGVTSNVSCPWSVDLFGSRLPGK